MRITWLRRLVRRGNGAGILLAAGFLLLRFLWLRKVVAVPALAAATGIALVFLHALHPGHKPMDVPQETTSAPSTYRVTDLGTLPNQPQSAASAINNKAQIVGWSGAGAGLKGTRAFLWHRGRMQALGVRQGDFSTATGINDKGHVVGWWATYQAGSIRSFLWRNGGVEDIGALPGHQNSEANGINNRDEVVGASYTGGPGGSANRAFLWNNGSMTDLGTLPGTPNDEEAVAYGINDSGRVVGYSSWYYWFRGFLCRDGKMQELKSPGQRLTYASAVNARDQVVGALNTGLNPNGKGRLGRACLWHQGQVTDLGTLGQGRISSATAINDQGEIVGWSYVSEYKDQEIRAFVWQRGKMHDLNGLIAPDTGWVLVSANGINDLGQIVGTGTFNGKTRAFLLTPSRR